MEDKVEFFLLSQRAEGIHAAPHFGRISVDERRSRAGMDGWAIGQTLVIARAAGALCLTYGSWGGHRRKPDREDAPADGAGRHHDWGATDGMTCTFSPSGGNGGNGDPQSTLKSSCPPVDNSGNVKMGSRSPRLG